MIDSHDAPRAIYDAFGFVGAQGYQEDADSGLKLLGHRYYDASTGRFLTRDPAKDGRNWYDYAGNEPTVGIDPSGHFWIVILAAVIAGIAIYEGLKHHGDEGLKVKRPYKKALQEAADPDGLTEAPNGGPPSWAQEAPPEFQKYNRRVGQFVIQQMNDQYVNTTISTGLDTVHEGAGNWFDLGTGLTGLTTDELERLRKNRE